MRPITFLCISCYFKGQDFLRACKAAGNTVYLLTRKSLEHQPWPKEAIDEFFYIDSEANSPENLSNISRGLAWLMRNKKVDRIVAIDDFDVETGKCCRQLPHEIRDDRQSEAQVARPADRDDGGSRFEGGDLARYLITPVGKRARQENSNAKVGEVWGWLPPPL